MAAVQARAILKRIVRLYTDSRRRNQLAVGAIGAFLAAAGMLAWVLVSPEIPFASAPAELIREAQPGDFIKIYGRIECNCVVAVNYTEERVGTGPSAWNATYEVFRIRDPTGLIQIDTDSMAYLKPGPHSGDYWPDDMAAISGFVYDQGGGALALRAQQMGKHVDDTPAKDAPFFAFVATIGGLLVLFAAGDRFYFGSPRT